MGYREKRLLVPRGGKLPPKRYAEINLAFIIDLTAEQTAKRLSLNLGTINDYFLRLRMKLFVAALDQQQLFGNLGRVLRDPEETALLYVNRSTPDHVMNPGNIEDRLSIRRQEQRGIKHEFLPVHLVELFARECLFRSVISELPEADATALLTSASMRARHTAIHLYDRELYERTDTIPESERLKRLRRAHAKLVFIPEQYSDDLMRLVVLRYVADLRTVLQRSPMSKVSVDLERLSNGPTVLRGLCSLLSSLH